MVAYSEIPFSGNTFIFLILCSLSSFVFGIIISSIYSFITLDVGNPNYSDHRRLINTEYFKESESAHSKHSFGWFQSARGPLLFHQEFLPVNGPIKAVVAISHGFGDHSSGLSSRTALSLAEHGYAVILMDFEGHGKSDGLHGLVSDLDLLVEDMISYIDQTMAGIKALSGKKLFLYGESMGGAITFKISTRKSKLNEKISGAILMAPMIKIADDMRPPELVITVLLWLVQLFPTAAITPVPSIIDKCFKDQAVLKIVSMDKLAYKQPPRLSSAVALKKATDEIAASMESFSLPVLILHGGADQVTCSKISSELYNRCTSEDKTIKIYPGCWHNLLYGETKSESVVVLKDIVSWLNDRLY